MPRRAGINDATRLQYGPRRCHARRPPKTQNILSVRPVAKNRFRRCEAGSAGAPEARGNCFANGTCAPVGAHTHAFDVGAKVWALPAIATFASKKHAAAAAAVAALAAKMRAPEPGDRPTFAAAVAELEAARPRPPPG